MSEIIHIFNSGGIVMYPILMMAIISIWIIFERLLTFKVLASSNKSLIRQVFKFCKEYKSDEALVLLKDKSGIVTGALKTIILHKEKSVETIERYVQEVSEEFLKYYQFVKYINNFTKYDN